MKYCIFCGHEIDNNITECQYCSSNVSEDNINKVYHSQIKCIKCNSTNVDYKIEKINIDDMTVEQEIYTCNNCGKTFKEKNRLGKSINNVPLIAIDGRKKNIYTIILIIILTIVFVNIHNSNKIKEENSWLKMSCNGLTTIQFSKIQEEAESNLDKARKDYIGKSFIFDVNIFSIKDREITNSDPLSNHAYSYINVNKEEETKISYFKQGDKIKICGTIDKISWYTKSITINNATILEG